MKRGVYSFMKQDEFLSTIKPKKGLLIVGLLFLGSCLGQIGVAYKNASDEMKKPVSVYDVSKENQYTCIDVQFLTESIATQTGGQESQDAAIAWNTEEMSLVSLTKDMQKDFKDILNYSYTDDEDAKAPETKKLCGYTKQIPSKLKSLTVEAYKEIFGSSNLTLSNFNAVFGSYYIDGSSTPMKDFTMNAAIGGMVSIVGFVILGVYVKNVLKTKKALQTNETRIEEIKRQVGAPDAIHEPKAKLYLTKDYLINYANGLEIYENKDIVWIYPHELRRNGFVQSRSIYVVTSNSKVHIVASLNASKKNNQLFDEVYQEFMIKLPDILHGYTKENREEAKNRYKK